MMSALCLSGQHLTISHKTHTGAGRHHALLGRQIHHRLLREQEGEILIDLHCPITHLELPNLISSLSNVHIPHPHMQACESLANKLAATASALGPRPSKDAADSFAGVGNPKLRCGVCYG